MRGKVTDGQEIPATACTMSPPTPSPCRSCQKGWPSAHSLDILKNLDIQCWGVWWNYNSENYPPWADLQTLPNLTTAAKPLMKMILEKWCSASSISWVNCYSLPLAIRSAKTQLELKEPEKSRSSHKKKGSNQKQWLSAAASELEDRFQFYSRD